MASRGRSKVCPDDFTKTSLIRLASKELGVPPKKIERLNKISLCKSIESGQITSVKATKRKATTKPIVAPVAVKKPVQKKPVVVAKKPPLKKLTTVPKKSVATKKTAAKKPVKKVAPAKKPAARAKKVVVSPYPDPEGPPR